MITFIGNCQTASLCFYFQQLLGSNNISWVLYGNEFLPHLGNWSNPIKNKIINYDESIQVIKTSDVIIYQEISTNRSLFCSTEKLESYKLIKFPSIYLDYLNYDASILELKNEKQQIM
jgi:hypothetical protein